MHPWERVALLAQWQHGVVSRRQIVRDAGVCGRVLTERVREQGWSRPYRGIYVLPGTPDSFEQAASAALLAVGGQALLTGRAAAYLLALRAARPRNVEVALALERGTRPKRGVVLRRHHAAALQEWRRERNLPLVAPAVMLCDLARVLDEAGLARAVAAGCARRLVRLDGLVRDLDELGPHPGAAALGCVLERLRGGMAHSEVEGRGRRLLSAAGVPLHPTPYAVLDRDRFVAEIDLAVPIVRYGAEIDGPHHLIPEQVAADKARDRWLARLGWTIDRFPVEVVERTPQEFVRQVLARLRALDCPLPAEVEH